jgi:glutathione S-transferase
MTLIFFAAPMSSATPVASALAELGVPHERINFDLSEGKHKQPEFLKLNPNGKVPTLVVDGTPMFEALAIMQWLGDRYGVERKLWPRFDAPERLVALSWSTWGYVTYGPALMRLNQACSPRVSPELHSAAQAEHAHKELDQLLGVLDARLADRQHLLGETYSLADLIVASCVMYGTMLGVPVDGHAHVKGWLDRFRQRPAIRSAWALA